MADLERNDDQAAPGAGDGGLTATEREILRALRGVRYGSVEITIHDGAVVQIERKEKVRLGVTRGGGKP